MFSFEHFSPATPWQQVNFSEECFVNGCQYDVFFPHACARRGASLSPRETNNMQRK
jgi:hypothetical protein